MTTYNMDMFQNYQRRMGVGVSFAATTTVFRNIYTFGTDKTQLIPYHIRTGDNALGEPLIKKKFRDVRFHALEDKGTLHVRIYIDGRYVCDGQSTVATNPNKIRQVNIPIQKCMGYCIDLEFSGDVPLRGVVFTYDVLDGTVSV
jgi:hypothetical protein